MYVGIQDYTIHKDYYPREMGESCPPRKPQNTEYREYRPREMGEDPASVPSRAQQQANYDRAQGYYSSPCQPTYEHRPREIGETPEMMAQAEERARASRPRRGDEMTEQERRIDLLA